MTAVPALLILAALAVYLSVEHRLRHAVTAHDADDATWLEGARERETARWFAALDPAAFQTLAENMAASLAGLADELVRTRRSVNATVDVLAPLAAAMGPPPRRLGRVRGWVSRTFADAVAGGTVTW